MWVKDYTVQAGDSWARIAGNMYGNQRYFALLSSYNGGVDLHPGMVIKIPDLLGTEPGQQRMEPYVPRGAAGYTQIQLDRMRGRQFPRYIEMGGPGDPRWMEQQRQQWQQNLPTNLARWSKLPQPEAGTPQEELQRLKAAQQRNAPWPAMEMFKQGRAEPTPLEAKMPLGKPHVMPTIGAPMGGPISAGMYMPQGQEPQPMTNEDFQQAISVLQQAGEPDWEKYNEVFNEMNKYVWVPPTGNFWAGLWDRRNATGYWKPVVMPAQQLLVSFNDAKNDIEQWLQANIGFNSMWSLTDVLTDPNAPPSWVVPQGVWDRTGVLRSGLGDVTGFLAEAGDFVADKGALAFRTMTSMGNWIQKSVESAFFAPSIAGRDPVNFWYDFFSKNHKMNAVEYNGQIGYWMLNAATQQWDFVTETQMDEWRKQEYEAYATELREQGIPDTLAETGRSALLQAMDGGTSDIVYDWGYFRQLQFESLVLNPDGSIDWAALMGDPLGRTIGPRERVWMPPSKGGKGGLGAHEGYWKYVHTYKASANIAEAIWNSTSPGGMSFTFFLNMDLWMQFMDDVDNGMSVTEGLAKYENVGAEILTSVTLDPIGIFGVGRLGKVGRTIDRIVSGAITAGLSEAIPPVLGVVLKPLMKTKPGETRLLLRAMLDEKNMLGESTMKLTRESFVKQWSQHVEDTARFLIDVQEKYFPNMAVDDFWQRLMLEGSDPAIERTILLETYIPKNRILQWEDGVACLKETLDTVEIEKVLGHYGALEDVSEGLKPKLIKGMLENTSDSTLFGHYLTQAMTDQYARQLGLHYLRSGSLARALNWTSRLMKEWWLGLSFPYQINNFTDNTVKTIVSGYSPTFDLRSFSRIENYLMDSYGWHLPENTVQSLVAETIGDIDRVGATEMLPWPIGKLESVDDAMVWLKGHPTTLSKTVKDWMTEHQRFTGLMNKFSVSSWLNKGFQISAKTEKAARANIFLQEFERVLDGVARPDMVEWVTKQPPTLHLDPVAGLFANGSIKSLDDIMDVRLRYLGTDPGQWIPETFWGDMRPPGTPTNQAIDILQRRLNDLHIKAVRAPGAVEPVAAKGAALTADALKEFDDTTMTLTSMYNAATKDILENSEIGIDSLARAAIEAGVDPATLPKPLQEAMQIQLAQREADGIVHAMELESDVNDVQRLRAEQPIELAPDIEFEMSLGVYGKQLTGDEDINEMIIQGMRERGEIKPWQEARAAYMRDRFEWVDKRWGHLTLHDNVVGDDITPAIAESRLPFEHTREAHLAEQAPTPRMPVRHGIFEEINFEEYPIPHAVVPIEDVPGGVPIQVREGFLDYARQESGGQINTLEQLSASGTGIVPGLGTDRYMTALFLKDNTTVPGAADWARGVLDQVDDETLLQELRKYADFEDLDDVSLYLDDWHDRLMDYNVNEVFAYSPEAKEGLALMRGNFAQALAEPHTAEELFEAGLPPEVLRNVPGKQAYYEQGMWWVDGPFGDISEDSSGVLIRNYNDLVALQKFGGWPTIEDMLADAGMEHPELMYGKVWTLEAHYSDFFDPLTGKNVSFESIFEDAGVPVGDIDALYKTPQARAMREAIGLPPSAEELAGDLFGTREPTAAEAFAGPPLLPPGPPTVATWLAQHPVSTTQEALQRLESLQGAKILGLGVEGADEAAQVERQVGALSGTLLSSSGAQGWPEIQKLFADYPQLLTTYESAVSPRIGPDLRTLLTKSDLTPDEVTDVVSELDRLTEAFQQRQEVSEILRAQRMPTLAQMESDWFAYRASIVGWGDDFWQYIVPTDADLRQMEDIFDNEVKSVQSVREGWQNLLDEEKQGKSILFDANAAHTQIAIADRRLALLDQLKNTPPGAERIAVIHDWLIQTHTTNPVEWSMIQLEARKLYGGYVTGTWLKDYYTDYILRNAVDAATPAQFESAFKTRGIPMFRAWRRMPMQGVKSFWAESKSWGQIAESNRAAIDAAAASAGKEDSLTVVFDNENFRVGAGLNDEEAIKNAFGRPDADIKELFPDWPVKPRGTLSWEPMTPDELSTILGIPIEKLGKRPILVGEGLDPWFARQMLDAGFAPDTPFFDKNSMALVQGDPKSARFPNLRNVLQEDFPANWAPGYTLFYPRAGGVEQTLDLNPHYDELLNGDEMRFRYDADEHVFTVADAKFDPTANDYWRTAIANHSWSYLDFGADRSFVKATTTNPKVLRAVAFMLDELGLHDIEILDFDDISHTVKDLIDEAPPIRLFAYGAEDVPFEEAMYRFSPRTPVHEMNWDQIEDWYYEALNDPDTGITWFRDFMPEPSEGYTRESIHDWIQYHPSIEYHRDNILNVVYHGGTKQRILKAVWLGGTGTPGYLNDIEWGLDIHPVHGRNVRTFMTSLGPDYLEVEGAEWRTREQMVQIIPALREQGVPLDTRIRIWGGTGNPALDETRTLGDWLGSESKGVRPIVAKKVPKIRIVGVGELGEPWDATLPRALKQVKEPNSIMGVFDINEHWYWRQNVFHDIDADGAAWFTGTKNEIVMEFSPQFANDLTKQKNAFKSLIDLGLDEDTPVVVKSVAANAQEFRDTHTLGEWMQGIETSQRASPAKFYELTPQLKPGARLKFISMITFQENPPLTINGQPGILGGVFDPQSNRFVWQVHEGATFNHNVVFAYLHPGERRGLEGTWVLKSDGIIFGAESYDHAVNFAKKVKQLAWQANDVPLRITLLNPDPAWPWQGQDAWNGTVGEFAKSTSALPTAPGAATGIPEIWNKQAVIAFNDAQAAKILKRPKEQWRLVLDPATGRVATGLHHLQALEELGQVDQYFVMDYFPARKTLYVEWAGVDVTPDKLAPLHGMINDDTHIIALTPSAEQDLGTLWEFIGAAREHTLAELGGKGEGLAQFGGLSEAEFDALSWEEQDRIMNEYMYQNTQPLREAAAAKRPAGLVASEAPVPEGAAQAAPVGEAPSIPGNVNAALQGQAMADWRATELGKTTTDYAQSIDTLQQWKQKVLGDIAGGRGGTTGGWFRTQQEWDDGKEAFDAMSRRWLEHLDKASYQAVGKVNSVLFDYTARGKIEELLRAFAPFTTWQLRNPMFWAQAFSKHPGILNMAVRFMQSSERQRNRYGLTERFRNTFGFNLPSDFGPIPAGYYGFNMTPFVSLFNQFRPPFETPEAFAPTDNKFILYMRRALQYARTGGLNMWPWINYPLEAIGVAAKGSTQWSLGPIQRVIELGMQQSGVLKPGQGLLGMNQTSQWLNEYYVRRRLAEMEQEGEITHEQGLAAMEGTDQETLQLAQQEVLRMTGMGTAWGLLSPFTMKYATPGEVGLRTGIQQRNAMLQFAQGEYPTRGPEYTRLEDWIYSRFPSQETYGLAMANDTRRVQVAQLFDKYDQLLEGLMPWSDEYKQIMAQRAAEMETMFGNQQDPRILMQGYSTMGPDQIAGLEEDWQKRDTVLGWLEDVQPRAGLYTDPTTGAIDWGAYELEVDNFIENVPGLSRQFGYEVSYADFIKYHYRSAAPERVAYDLYKEFRNNQWDQYYATRPELEPGGKYWDEMVTTTAETERLKDLELGFTPYEADLRYAENLKRYITEGEIPYEYYMKWRQNILDPLIIKEPINLDRFTFQVADILGINIKRYPARYDLMRELDVELPGMVQQDVYDKARTVLSNWYYDQLTPDEQDDVSAYFGAWGIPKDDIDMYNMYVKMQFITDKVLFEPIGEPPRYYMVPPLTEVLTPEEEAEIGQAQVDLYRYWTARDAGVGGTWTPLLTKFYSDESSNQSKFWGALSTASLSSASFDDPVISQFLSRSARNTMDYTEEQWGAAYDYLMENWDTLIDAEKTEDIRNHPDWYMQCQQERTEFDRFKDLDMEVKKADYYALPWGDARDAWETANPEEAKALLDYIARERTRAFQYPYYMYWFKQSDYKRYFGNTTPDKVAANWDVAKISDDFAQAIKDMDAYINGSGIWTDLMQTFFGPPPPGYQPAKQP